MAEHTRAGTSRAGPTVSDMPRVTSYAEAEEVLGSRDFASVLHARDSAAVVADNVLTLVGEEHRRRRRDERDVVSPRALVRYEQEVLLPSLRLAFATAEAGRGVDGRVRVDLLDLARTALVHVTAAVIGLDGVDDPDTALDLQGLARQIGEGVSVEWSVRDHDEVLREALAARDAFVRRYYRPAVTRRRSLVERWRRGELADSKLPRDLVTTLLRHHLDDWDDGLWSREAAFYLVASANTTTYTVPHVFTELERWFGEHPADRARVGELDFLRRATQEGLRLHFPVPLLPRRALRDTVLTTTGRRVAGGGNLAVDVHAANRDPKVFGADADRFVPGREVARGHRPYGLSFGAGAHRCPGRPLAVGDPDRDEEPGARVGAIVRLIHELYAAGARVDPDDPPRLRDDTEQAKYARFPLVLDRM